MGHLVQMAGLAVQNFVSAAVGMAVAVALVRGFTRSRTDRVGNFWVDLVRGMPADPAAHRGRRHRRPGRARRGAELLRRHRRSTTLAGQSQTITGGPVASQEAIKELGTNGGGFYNANSAHPFENPNALSNLLEIFLLLLIPVCLTYTFGRMVKDKRQGYAILGAMAALVGADRDRRSRCWRPPTPARRCRLAGASMEGKETRFGEAASALFAASTTGTSTGAVDSFHSSFTALGGGLAIFNMGLGEVAPGGVGSGLYGMLVLAIVTVFVAGLMVGRTPEYLGKKITGREIKLVSLYILTMPVLVLAGTGLAMGLPGPKQSILNPGPHGLSEVLYAFMSAGQQQRLRVRRAVGQHRLLQHRARSGDARRPVRPDRARAGAGRVAGGPAAGPRDRRHPADPPPAVRRDARRRRPRRRRPDLLPRAGPRTDGGGPVMPLLAGRTPQRPPSPEGPPP